MPRRYLAADATDHHSFEMLDERALEAARWTDKEIRNLMGEIKRLGSPDDQGCFNVNFGVLFEVYLICPTDHLCSHFHLLQHFRPCDRVHVVLQCIKTAAGRVLFVWWVFKTGLLTSLVSFCLFSHNIRVVLVQS